ncbi:UNVERIFIED_ORG: polyisoprenoid-binding protein YceI [Sphingomonas sp. R1F5B]
MTCRNRIALVLALASSAAVLPGSLALAQAPAAAVAAPALPAMLQSLPAGRYVVDPAQTVARFKVRYLGVNHVEGTVPGASGTIMLDPANLETMALDVVMPATAIATQDGTFDDELKGPGLFDVAHYPTIRFSGRRLVPTGPNAARIEGEVTMHGVTRPLLLDATFADPAGAAPGAGLAVNASGVVHRSEFGMTKFAPFVSDDVRITITAVLNRAG